VTVSPNAAASNLVAGSYTANLSFTNLGNGFGQNRLITLAVVTPPVITSQPSDQAVLQGGTAIFSVGTASNALLVFQWQTNGLPLSDGGRISGSATSTLVISNASSANVGTYSVIVSNVAGVKTSSNALLTVISSAPVITMQPTNQSVLSGAPATFSVVAIGNTPFFYQWQRDGTNLSNGPNVSGATSSALSLGIVSPADVGGYAVIITNFLGSTTSIIAALSVTPVTAAGVDMTSLSTFGSGSDGQYLYCPLVQGGNGNFYGTTVQGGTSGNGTVFRAGANGSHVTLFSFNNNNGSAPFAGVIQGRDGNLYGMTSQGGAYGDGVVFKLSGGGTITTLAAFNGNNGLFPVAGLVQASDGNFYGTTLQGGAYGYGTVFRMTGGGILTTLVSFNNTDGAFPSCALVQGADGSLYGTTENGGTNGGAGTVFKMTLSGAFTSLYSFTGGNDGGVPVPGVVQATDGNFYGNTLQGGRNGGFGTVFQITPSGTLTTLYSFAGAGDGDTPWGGLMLSRDGNLYGTTQGGGAYGFGTVFRMAPNGPLSKLVDFDSYNGSYPSAALIQANDNSLFGTTEAGGSLNFGTLFRLIFNAPLQITGQPANQAAFIGGKASFSVATFGNLPVFYQWQKGGENLIDGGNLFGANSRTLTITNITLDDLGIYSVIVSNAQRSLASANAVLQVTFSPPYFTSQPIPQTRIAGTTATFSVGVLGDLPISYQWQENGTNLADGGNISGSANSVLTITNISAANAGLYSVIASNAFAAVSSGGALLEVIPAAVAGTSASISHLFTDSTDGAFPYAGLIQGNDGNLYGTTSGGGSKFAGTTFRLSLSGAFTPLYSFLDGSQGAFPYSGLVQLTNGSFYGTTLQGGAFNDGTIFRMTAGGTVTLLYSFAGNRDGALPVASLTPGRDGNFYGTAFAGGANSSGSVYKMTPAGVVTPLHQFTGGPDGAFPYAGLTLGIDGKFYGTTQAGGGNGYGTVFQITSNGVLITLVSFGYTNGANPDAGVIQGRDGNLYGATFQGGERGYGTVFKVTTNGTLTTLASFDYQNGANPVATLVLGTDGNFYGATAIGGVGGEGTLFSITTNGTLRTLLWFDGVNGASPQAPLIQASDGNFYGTTSYGGAGYNGTAGGGYGTVFRLTVPIFSKNPFTLAPAISAIPYSATISNQAVSLPGDTLTFAKISGPAWLGVSPDGIVSGTPTDADIGANTFAISLSDTNGFFASTTMNIVVNSNAPPSFTAASFTEPWANVDQGYSASIALTATDPELGQGEVLTFAKVSGPGWLSIAPDGGLVGIPHGSNAGTNKFVVSVTDLEGSSDTAAIYIYVNSAPYFANAPFTGPTALSRLPYSGTIATNAVDPDLGAGDTLTFYKVNGAAWLTVGIDSALSGTAAERRRGH